MTLWKTSKVITLTIPMELLYQVDEAAKGKYRSRSDFIRAVLNDATIEYRQTNQPLDQPINRDWLDTDDA